MKKTTPSMKAQWAGVFFLLAIIAVFIGLLLIFEPGEMVGGDAYNYIIAATRGTGVIAGGVGLAVVGVGFLLMDQIDSARGQVEARDSIPPALPTAAP
jgi:hypothetical protein